MTTIEGFTTFEHVIIGDDVDIAWCTQNGQSLRFGQIMALAGDYYGKPESPIVAIDDHGNDSSSAAERFMAAYQTLDYAPKKDLEKLVTMMNSGKNYNDQEWDKAPGGYWTRNGIPLKCGRMLKLTKTNYDHFTPQAEKAYLIGHQLARKKALKAHNRTGKLQKVMLSEAYSLEAFACHFLTDSFSSGHIRTPRVELGKLGLQGHWLSKYMHDEDGKFGLRVTNANGNQWTSFGDDMLLKSCSKKNFDMVKYAVQVSVAEVDAAYYNLTGDLGPSLVPKLIPFVDSKKNNNSPLFQVKGGKVLKRLNVNDLQDKKTIDNWWLSTTVGQLAYYYSPEKSAI